LLANDFSIRCKIAFSTVSEFYNLLTVENLADELDRFGKEIFSHFSRIIKESLHAFFVAKEKSL